ncbi:MAG: glucose-6-phosphate dehydrogenase assembly protein OpcA [Pyrinomonadaceae bacterium]
MQLIQIEKTLDVAIVERQLAELWKQTSDDRETDDEAAVLRARVANLLVFVSTDELLEEVHQMLPELTAIHPSRVLMMLGDRGAADLDIEMGVGSLLQTDKRGGRKRLCCEEVTLKAQGNFVVELPSATLPLLVSDLTTFLWWRDAVQVTDKVFDTLLRATDRLVIDSAEFENPRANLGEINKLFAQENQKGQGQVGISDLNWARLTLWRGLLADFYDVPAYQERLDEIDYVRIDYVAPERQPTTVATQALLIAGWLASRLGWSLPSDQTPGEDNETLSFKFSGKARDSGSTKEQGSSVDRGSSPTVKEGSRDREITLELSRVKHGEHLPGKLIRVELRMNADKPASFTVTRSADNLHLLAEAKLGPHVHRGRVLPVRNRSAAQLLSREMEILCNDRIYEEALAIATNLLNSSMSPSG